MTTEETNNQGENMPFVNKNYKEGRIISGLILVAVGSVFLAKQMGTVFPNWLFTWPVLLIVIGFFIGAKHNFKRGGWWIVSLVGTVFLIDKLTPGINISHLFWPVLIIIIGLVYIFKPKRKWQGEHCKTEWKEKMKNHYTEYNERGNPDDYMESVSIFGGVKKNIISKNFKGGEIVCIFGGSEINLMQADINGRVVLEVVQVFGGTKLIVPAHWSVLSEEMVAILGGIEDKRPPYVGNTVDDTKVLVIKGTSIFAGIDIRSY